MTDAWLARGGQNHTMKRLGVLALAVFFAACAPAAVAPPSAEPTVESTAVPAATGAPDEYPVATPSTQPTQAPNSGPPQVLPPKVALVQQAFSLGTLPSPTSATAEEIETSNQQLAGWTASFAEMLGGYQWVYAADAQKQ